jgi:predicted nucleotidyltransferase
MFRLNQEHRIVHRMLLPLIEGESEFRAQLRSLLRKTFQKEVVAGLIFGSVGRGEDRPESDLDLCLIVRRVADKDRVLHRVGELSASVRREYGVRLSPIAFTTSELTAGLSRKDPLMMNIKEEGEQFIGRSLESLAYG